MKFKNRANEEVKLVDGRTVWLSRSPAVVGIILVEVSGEIFVLTEKRSEMMDEPNKWAVVSGYLDWDESGIEGIKRETFEETSFNIDSHKKDLIWDNDEQPFYVHTDPWTDAKQNVSLSYIFVYNMKLSKEVETFTDAEISEVKWMNVKDLQKIDTFWAFNHDERIEMAIQKYFEWTDQESKIK